MRLKIFPLSKRLRTYCLKHNITKQFEKQCTLFKSNPFHSSLETEVLEPKHLRIYSFRISRRYRAIFIYRDAGTIEIIDVNNHYQ